MTCKFNHSNQNVYIYIYIYIYIYNLSHFTLFHIFIMTTSKVTDQSVHKLFLYAGFPNADNEIALPATQLWLLLPVVVMTVGPKITLIDHTNIQVYSTLHWVTP